MQKFFLAVFAIFLTLTHVSPHVLAKGPDRPPQNVFLAPDAFVDRDYFAAGDNVTLSGIVTGDAYLAGSNVTVDGEILGDLLVAGGTVTVSGNVAGDIRIAGGELNLQGIVGGNITALGGTVKISDSAEVSGSLVIGAKDATILAPIGRGITAGVGSLYLGESVSGDVNYWSEQEIALGPDASVSGSLTRHTPPQTPYDQQKFSRAMSGMFGAFTFISLLGSFLLGAFFLKLAPNFMVKVIKPISSRPWASLFTGFAFLILTPIATVFLLFTVIGAPLAGLVFLLYLVLLILAKVFAGLYVGTKLFSFFGKSPNAYFSLFVGLIVYQLLWFVPLLGWLVVAALYLGAVGSIVLSKKDLYLTLVSKKLV